MAERKIIQSARAARIPQDLRIFWFENERTSLHRSRIYARRFFIKADLGSPWAYPGETFHHFKTRRDKIRRTISFQDFATIER